jgi:hydroxymethylbilane synthase
VTDNLETRPILRLATRSSPLALWQAQHVQSLLAVTCPATTITLVQVSTVGDRDRQSTLSAFGGQGVFTKEIQAAVREGRADIAVHSLKDLPTVPVDKLVLAGTPERGPRVDVLVLPQGQCLAALAELPEGARLATGSLRRRAQLLHVRPDLQFVDVRGNVETRLRKLDEGEFDGLVLAEAGLERLGLAARITLRLGPPEMLPAVGQAALGLECRADHTDAIAAIASITVDRFWREVRAERSCLRTLKAGCHAPVGVSTTWDRATGQLHLEAVVLSANGQTRLHAEMSGPSAEPEALGIAVANELIARGAEPLLSAESHAWM